MIFAPFLGRVAPLLVAAGKRAAPAPYRLPERAPEMPVAAHLSGYRRIAVALEIGPADPPVLEHVWRLALATGAELILIHVAESAASRVLGDQSLDQKAREDRRALEDLAGQFRERGIRVSVALGHGRASTELARQVVASGADILVTGSHGHRLLQDILLGTTVSGVRHRIGIPILTVPGHGGEAADLLLPRIFPRRARFAKIPGGRRIRPPPIRRRGEGGRP
jgi:manganese transport protein